MEFKHGDVIEYQALNDGWRKGIYIASHPNKTDFHIHLNDTGLISYRERDAIRKPKVKKEGWMFIRSHIYESGGRECSLIYDTELICRNKADAYPDVVSVVKVEWEE